jgi:mono/diheme cytochrome c family protein
MPRSAIRRNDAESSRCVRRLMESPRKDPSMGWTTLPVAALIGVMAWPSALRAALPGTPDQAPAGESPVFVETVAAETEAAEPHSEHEHDAADPANRATIDTGRQVFARNCAGCHGSKAEGKIGPKLVGTPHSRTEIQHFVTHGIPMTKMPAFEKKLFAGQIAAVAAYVKSLGPAKSGAEHDHQHGEPGATGAHEHEHGQSQPGEAAKEGMIGMSRVVGQQMTREGSGTSWVPESSPMWAAHARWGQWNVMQHGNLVLMYDHQGGPRGVSRTVSTNWYMLMGNRQLGKGELMLRTMLSLEPATIGNNGMPQLFQTGEGLIDRQHPHDLFMELAGQYSHPLSAKLGAYLYLAPVGEPALGPPAYMHRVSAMEIPTAPLIHHWTDSTHISYGVVTAGIQSQRWKLEGSWFNGHEPDSNRWAIDPLALNSFAGRLSYAPSKDWAFQVSHGHLSHPEINYPDEQQGDVDRTTFSALYNRPLPRGNWATTFTWGHNKQVDNSSDGLLVESNYNWADRNYLFGRIERVEKDELFHSPDPRAEQQFTINAFSLGYARDIGLSKSFETALGVMATVYGKPDSLDPVYGSSPMSYQVFLRIRLRRMQMGGHGMHEGPMQHGGHP